MQLPSYICCFLYCLLDHFLRINSLNQDGHKAQRYTVSKSILREMFQREAFQREPSVLLDLSVLAPIGSPVNLVIPRFLACRSTAGASHEWVISSTASETFRELTLHCLEAESHMLQDGFELSMQLRMTLNFGSSSLHFPNAGIMGLCYQTQFIWHWELNPGPGIC